jgi:hypothetical protein
MWAMMQKFRMRSGGKSLTLYPPAASPRFGCLPDLSPGLLLLLLWLLEVLKARQAEEGRR